MRILIVIPRQPAATGNHITAERQRHELEQLGHEVRLLQVEVLNPQPLAAALRDFHPEAALLLHAWRSGQPWLQVRESAAIPCVVSLTGTDLAQDLATPERGPVIREVLARAAAIVTQNPLTADALRHEHPEWGQRLHYLPAAAVLGDVPFALRQTLGVSATTPVLLHAAGLRPVKRNLELLLLFDEIARKRQDFVVAFCGPPLDPAYAARFRQGLATRPWARYLGVIPPAAMAAVLRETDVVLNHSASEGLPNALLEAAVVGRPMLARAIPGNAAVVQHGINGLLYTDDEEFRSHVRTLLDNPVLRRRLAVPDGERFRPETEARALQSLLRSIAETPPNREGQQ